VKLALIAKIFLLKVVLQPHKNVLILVQEKMGLRLYDGVPTARSSLCKGSKMKSYFSYIMFFM